MTYFEPGEPYPDPTDATGPTQWAPPATDYAGRPDGVSGWAAADPPGGVPPAVEPVAERVGWLLAHRPAPGAISQPSPE